MKITSQKQIIAIMEKEGDDYTFEHKSYTCEIRRTPNLLHLCGYVYLKSDEEFDMAMKKIDCHGGITYSNKENYIIGFDCGHIWDLVPRMYFLSQYQFMFSTNEHEYRTLDYVKNECMNIVEQLITLK